MMIDNYYKKCRSCKKGYYIEMRPTDDWDGILHCEVCYHEVPRYTLKGKLQKSRGGTSHEYKNLRNNQNKVN